MASSDSSRGRVWVLFHHPREGLGIIANALVSRKIAARPVRTFREKRMPRELGEAAGLVLMGGPQSVYEQDRYPFLGDEIRLIEEALRRDRPVLGVCLGSELFAAVLGAEVKPGRKELGWHQVTLTGRAARDRQWRGVKNSFTAYHWHGDGFELPRGAVALASSDLTASQAFRYRRKAYGVLFHMEVTERMIQQMVRTFTDDVRAAGLSRSAILGKASTYLPPLHEIGSLIFGRRADLVLEDRR